MKKPSYLPYNELKEIKPDWLDEMKQDVENCIKLAENQYKEEVEYEGVPEFLDQKFIYERFKDNCRDGMINGNWEVLKYFVLNFEIKILKSMIGKWEFTDADKEMYNYFNNLHVDERTKCKPAMLKLKSGAKLLFSTILDYKKYKIYYEFESKDKYENNVCEDHYFLKFANAFECITMMTNNCKMNAKYRTLNFFNDELVFISNIFEYYLKNGRKTINKSATKIVPTCEKNDISTEQTSITKFLAELEAYCYKDSKFVELQIALNKIWKDKFFEFSQSNDMFSKLSQTDKYTLLKQFE